MTKNLFGTLIRPKINVYTALSGIHFEKKLNPCREVRDKMLANISLIVL